MQHRGIINRLVAGNRNVQDLRYIQQVAELFQKEAETCGKGDSLTACDAVRLLMDLAVVGLGSEAYGALYSIQEGKNDSVDDVLDILEGLDGRQISLVLAFARALAGK